MKETLRIAVVAAASAWLAFGAVAARAFQAPAEGDRRLIAAAQAGNAVAVRTLLKAHVDVNAASSDGATALHWAANRDDLDIATQLVRAGARVDAANDLGVTPLSLACLNGSVPVVKLLLDSGANPNRALPTGETPLMTAARTGSLGAVTLLLARGADVHAKETVHGQTALMWAVSQQHVDVSRALVAAGADVNARSKTSFTPLMFAARQGNQDLVRSLLEAGAHVNDVASDGSSVLLIATVRGFPEVAGMLLDRGADPNADQTGFTALHWACGRWESAMTKDYPNAGGEWSVLGGVPTGRLELIKALLVHGANPNVQTRNSPPHFGIVQVFSKLTWKGVTPFYIAASSGDVDAMRILAAAGADTLTADDQGVTPLMVAAGAGRVAGYTRITEQSSLAAVALALDLGGPIGAADSLGETALHATALLGLNEVLQFLVGRGAPLNARNKKGETPLKYAEGVPQGAMFRSQPETAALLRKLGAVK